MTRDSQLPSSELVRRCVASRDPELWAEFIKQFQPVIASAVLRTARIFGEPPRQLVDDLIQDTYLKLCENDYRMLRVFEPRHEDAIFGYLKVVAANIVHDHFKSELAEKRGGGQTESIEEPVQIDNKTAGIDPSVCILRSLQLAEVEAKLLELTAGKEDQRRNCMIFWLRYRLGLTASEIAKLAGINLSTEGVESVLLRLLNMIKGHI